MTLDSIAGQTLTPLRRSRPAASPARASPSRRFTAASPLTSRAAELATNAAKYGFALGSRRRGSRRGPSNAGASAEDRRASCCTGPSQGGPPSARRRTNFGTELIGGMVEHELHGKRAVRLVPPGCAAASSSRWKVGTRKPRGQWPDQAPRDRRLPSKAPPTDPGLVFAPRLTGLSDEPKLRRKRVVKNLQSVPKGGLSAGAV